MKIQHLILLIILPVIPACEDWLDKAPDMGLTEEVVFNDFNSVRGYLDNCFWLTHDFSTANYTGTGRQHISKISDECAEPYGGKLSSVFNRGAWFNQPYVAEIGWATAGTMYFLPDGANNDNTPVGIIPRSFFGMRICNKIIEKVPEMNGLSQEQKDRLLGQAAFFRSWFYFEVIRRIGGMPILDRPFTSDDDFDLPRLSYGESTDWIVRELDNAVALLPYEWPETELGRPTKTAARALKSMAMLYAASPLMRNPTGRIDQYVEYDTERAKRAADLAWECLDDIEQNYPKQKMMPREEYKNIFYHSPNFVSDESLWYLNSTGYNRDGGEPSLAIHWQPIAFANRPGNFGQMNHSVSQNMIDMFETANGYPVRLEDDGWITEDPAFDPAQPFAGRDPRLTHFILLPGERFGTFKNSNTENYLCTWQSPEGAGTVLGREIDRPSASQVLTRYLLKKYQWETAISYGKEAGSAKSGYADNYYNCIHIRTTQVWLDYAEALNEAYGPTAVPAGHLHSAVDALNRVRNRVGMCNV
ncbi:MAG: RagB/SusD family nutrient uptake outer membrane protein, partial [Tannerella sp.]|nr:RagB/SusD family nutrient uptake outer membrane protein [Tannerella sp.]